MKQALEPKAVEAATKGEEGGGEMDAETAAAIVAACGRQPNLSLSSLSPPHPRTGRLKCRGRPTRRAERNSRSICTVRPSRRSSSSTTNYVTYHTYYRLAGHG